jgi:hypothetical protein
MRTVSAAPAWAATIQLPDDGRQIGADSQIVGVRDPINPGVEATTHRVEFALARLEPIGNRSWSMHSVGVAETATQIVVEKRIGLDQTGLVVSFPATTVTLSAAPVGFVFVYVKIADNSVSVVTTKPDASGYYKNGAGGTDFWYVGSFFTLTATTCVSFQYSDRTYTPAYDPWRDSFLFADPGVGYGTWLTNVVPRAPETARRVFYRFEFENGAAGIEQLLVNFFGTNVGNHIFTALPGLAIGGTICLMNPAGAFCQFHFFRNVNTDFRGYMESYEE